MLVINSIHLSVHVHVHYDITLRPCVQFYYVYISWVHVHRGDRLQFEGRCQPWAPHWQQYSIANNGSRLKWGLSLHSNVKQAYSTSLNLLLLLVQTSCLCAAHWFCVLYQDLGEYYACSLSHAIWPFNKLKLISHTHTHTHTHTHSFLSRMQTCDFKLIHNYYL